jgi:hypothetical protein
MPDFLAQSEVGDSYTIPALFAGDKHITTIPVKVLSGQNLAQYAVVARVSASGKVVAWAPAASDGSQIAIGVLVHAIDASAGDRDGTIYNGGSFNIDALVWPGGATTVQKVRAFDGTAIEVKALPGSTTVI